MTLSINYTDHKLLSAIPGSHYAECQYAKSPILFIVMLNVAILEVIMLSVIMLSVVMLCVVLLSVVLLNIIMLCIVMLSVTILSVVAANLGCLVLLSGANMMVLLILLAGETQN